jgi:hypothetical protein
MVVKTPVNAIKDATQVVNYTTQALVNQAINAYTSLFKTENGFIVNGNKISEVITLPINTLNNVVKEAKDVYERASNWINADKNSRCSTSVCLRCT